MEPLLQGKAKGLEFCANICARYGFRNDAAEGLDKTCYLRRLKLVALIQARARHRTRVSKARDGVESRPPNQAGFGRNIARCFFFGGNGRSPEVLRKGYPIVS